MTATVIILPVVRIERHDGEHARAWCQQNERSRGGITPPPRCHPVIIIDNNREPK